MTPAPESARGLITPSPSQRRAIEGPLGPLLVLAGPGAGKTFCLTERIGYLIEQQKLDPARICAFTFTNKAADEIAHRLVARLGTRADAVKRGTIHAFCADLLREFGSLVDVGPGFGIADDEYQRSVLRRIEGPRRWHGRVLGRFSAHRFRGEELYRSDRAMFEQYERYLASRQILDFDQLVLKTAELMDRAETAAQLRARWDAVLVDEFQDLNPVQYRIIKALAAEHRNIFAVGDDEQSIYSWAGADPAVFRLFANDFGITDNRISLEENRRCPHEVFALARKLVMVNTPIFADRIAPTADRVSVHPVRALAFHNDDDEAAWLVEDLKRDRDASGHRWGDVAVLYRTHDVGHRLETAFVTDGIPCRLARGHALGDDPVAGFVLAAVRLIASPDDELRRNDFFRAILPRALYDEALAKSEEAKVGLHRYLPHMASGMARGDERARQIRRALADWRNLEALGRNHTALAPLVHDLLSRRVGRVISALDDHHDELTDPAGLHDVVALAELLRTARGERTPVHLPPLGGAEIGMIGILAEIGVKAVRGDGARAGAIAIAADATPSVGLALGVFKAAQLVEMGSAVTAFDNFTAIDIETTERDTAVAEPIEIAAVRVRNGEIVDSWSSFVKPTRPITEGAAKVHHITAAHVADAPTFAEAWEAFRTFIGSDVAVAHNGYAFDFPILQRMARDCGATFDLCMYDSLPLARDLFATSGKLGDLADRFGIDLDQAHRAFDDTTALAHVLLAMGKVRQERARKTALVDLLGHLGVALALSDVEQMDNEAKLLRDKARIFALSRYGGALEWYDESRTESDPTRETLITLLGGERLMAKIRATKTADERYPVAMMRLRRLMSGIHDGTLAEQLTQFLERAALSTQDGREIETDRVNLMTLHSTKGLEFSRVYVIGVEDSKLPGGGAKGPRPEEVEEARRLLYVGMTRTIDRLVLTCTTTRGDKASGGHQFLDEMDLKPELTE